MDDKELLALLLSAIQIHDDSLLADLLDNGNPRHLLGIPCSDGLTLLHHAVMDNSLACVDCLLKNGADPGAFDANHARTPLHLAVELGLVEIVKLFLNLEHVDLQIRDDRNLTCYEIAQFCDNQCLAELILHRLDEIEKSRNEFYTVINQACSQDDPKLVKSLLAKVERTIIDRLPKSWLSEEDRLSFARENLKRMINWSSSSWNDVTLLFKSASKGQTEICKLLIEFGASAKCNENTNYSPLYVAAYGGYTETVRLLLDNFPSLVQEITIEKWTVLHACCLQGHSDTAKLILNYPYPEPLRRRYVSRSNLYEYHFAFDLNAQDAAGQTVVYLSVSANDESLLDALLQFNVEAKLIKQQQPNENQGIHSNKSRGQDKDVIGRARIIPDRPKSKLNPDTDSMISNGHTERSQLNKILLQLQRFKFQETSARTRTDNQTEGQNIRGVDSRAGPHSSPDHMKTATKLKDATDKYLICPFEIDTYCDYNSKTALHLAVCNQYHKIATTLLVNGSNPNLPILFRDSRIGKTVGSETQGSSSSLNDDIGLNWLRSSKSTCLKEACRLNDETMCEILIRYGARDNQDNLALQVASLNKNTQLISMFLSLKSNVDPEYKINRKSNVEFASRYKKNQKISNAESQITTTFSSMFPSTPVTIDWQNLKCIKQIDPQWLIEASLQHNKRLRHPTNSLVAITRLDLSNNNLKSVHPVIFRLPSLRELNLSSNRLESLMEFRHQLLHSTKCNSKFSRGFSNEGWEAPSPVTNKLIESQRTAMKRSRTINFSGITDLESSNLIDLNEPQEWELPCLEILDLHDNLLTSLPDCLFLLPKLSELDVSSNQLRQLPWAMWNSPSLREIIASGNLLDDLPTLPPQLFDRDSSACQAPKSKEGSLSGESSFANSSYQERKTSVMMLEQSFASSCASNDLSAQYQGPDATGENQFLSSLLRTSPSLVQLTTRKLTHLNHWFRKIDLIQDQQGIGMITTRDEQKLSENEEVQSSKITYMNLSHNSFTRVPPVLACLAGELLRLNMSHNCLQSLGNFALIPAKMKNLDFSNNQIAGWLLPSDQLGDKEAQKCFDIKCMNEELLCHACCRHKLHQRLDNLKSLNLSRNLLKTIELFSSHPNHEPNTSTSINEAPQLASSRSGSRRQLLFPNLTALDMSFNQLERIPPNMADLKDLSVLNLSGNKAISSLPAELGLASKLWNLGVQGCNLNEPLKSIVESKNYKTMDIIGYLRSILEEAKPYARMKLMLVGLQGIGKTSLLEQMRHEGSSSGSHPKRRAAPDHWTRRMGHSSRNNLRNQKGVTLSTVGVDIHEWHFQKKTPRNQPNYGPVSFSTWDFGGQEEFYATHRYFLSRRSIYLVVWRLTDGLPGILGIQQWLVNIQSRAPNSPVVIVGTHEDLIEGGEKGASVRELQQEVYRRFINVSDHEKCGLPKVADSIVVSTKTKLNIRHLCNQIYDVVFSLRCPGSTERLLEQKIPATYLYLEEIISSVVHDRHQKKCEPVLSYFEYRRVASEQLKLKYNKQFRDLESLESSEINYNSELHQATRFLHENGVLLHYEDTNLRDLYFLDPQWLCDILAHVVTIREINPHVRNGLMKIDDLVHLFKSIDMSLSGGVQSYVVNLLNKFEVALTWNTQYLLIPSLLPPDLRAITEQFNLVQRHGSNEQRCQSGRNENFQMKVTPRVRGRSAIRRPHDIVQQANRQALATSLRASSIDPSRRARQQYGNKSLASKGSSTDASDQDKQFEHLYEFEYEPEAAISRLVLLRYLPAGFLARLQSGLLSEPIFDDICEDLQLYFLNKLIVDYHEEFGGKVVEELLVLLGNRSAWLCWKNGICLRMQKESTINTRDEHSTNGQLIAPCLFTLQEYSSTSLSSNNNPIDRIGLQVECLGPGESAKVGRLSAGHNDGTEPHEMSTTKSKWIKFDQTQYSNVLMIVFPNASLRVTKKDDRSKSCSIRLGEQIAARLLAKIVDHIDDLLEDWYPSLGARFAHTLGGSYLVTRLIPCQKCHSILIEEQMKPILSICGRAKSLRVSRQRESTSGKFAATTTMREKDLNDSCVHCFYVEHCISNAYNLDQMDNILERKGKYPNGSPRRSVPSTSSPISPRNKSKSPKLKNLHCPRHGHLELASVAGDVLFNDVDEMAKIDSEQIERLQLIGRGALGFVFKVSLHSALFPLNQLGQNNQEVAMKLLQPVDPGSDAEQADQLAYKSALTNWLREPFQCACKSYCTARHEINILQTLCHPNIVQLVGLCLRPLSIVLELAPLGSLESVFKEYKRACLKIDQFTVQKTILQIARALEFLHQHRIIYRDLKTENVLVWSYPSPSTCASNQAHMNQQQSKSVNGVGSNGSTTIVELKLADYGISRQALSTGIWKGFAGTINFLAPEILRHNGDEEYTEKVDCFSFGMLLYELFTLRPPFKQSNYLNDSKLQRKSYLTNELLGSRPILFQRDLIYPNYFFDLMTICWSQEPQDRPTASQIVSIASAPEFMQIMDTIDCNLSASHRLKLDQMTFSSIYSEQNYRLDLVCCTNYGKTCDSIKPNGILGSFSAHRGQWSAAYEQLAEENEQDTPIGRSSLTASCVLRDALLLYDSNQSALHMLGFDQRLDSLDISASDCAFIKHDSDGKKMLSIHSCPIDCLAEEERSGQEVGSNRRTPVSRGSGSPVGSLSLDSSVKQMEFIHEEHCLIMLTSKGQLWISSGQMGLRQLDEVLGCSIGFNCFCLVPRGDKAKQEGSIDLICGQSNGISCLKVDLHSSKLVRQSIWPLLSQRSDQFGGGMKELADGEQRRSEIQEEVRFVLADGQHIWTAANCTVHLWNHSERQVSRKLDCWKLVPCSESLESINIEHYYQQAKSSTISGLVAVGDQLFVGTSHGCLIVIEASALKPIIVFRPYESELTIVRPSCLAGGGGGGGGPVDVCKSSEQLEGCKQEQQQSAARNRGPPVAPYLVLIGRGHRDLLSRYVGLSSRRQLAEPKSDISASILLAENRYNL